MTKQLSKKAQRIAEKEAAADRVRLALQDAMQEAQGAFDAFAATAERNENGGFVMPYGIATIYIYTPSYRFRVAMVEANALAAGTYSGEWCVNLPKNKPAHTQSLRANVAIADAYCAALKRHFPDERIFVRTHCD